MSGPGTEVTDALRRAGVGRGSLVGLAVQRGVGLGMAPPSGLDNAGRAIRPLGLAAPGTAALASAVGEVERAIGPRWVWWSAEAAATLVAAGVRVGTCWDLAAVHRLLAGGWQADPGRVWAEVHDLPGGTLPPSGPPDLFSQADDDGPEEEALRQDGHLRAAWTGGGWADTPARLARWAGLAIDVADRQASRLGRVDRSAAPATARSESAAELLCAELAADGLPMDRTVAEDLIARLVGPRPRSEAAAARQRAERDARVLRHVGPGVEVDLRSPGQVRSLLRRVGIEVPDTRASRLEVHRDAHPVVDALLAWRKVERIATTYGYAWLDEHLGADGRLRGSWSACDGAAGRMTATAGLHNMPAELRPAVVAGPGHVFVRADLGQIEPRVLAAVSGDLALARATAAEDLYAPVADQLGVDRATAKVAVLGAMYGQTTGLGGPMLRRLTAAYPVAMAYLNAGDRSARAGHDLRTYGGRSVRMGPVPVAAEEAGGRESPARAAARGRYGRNALVQGAAAELFKAWAATVRTRTAALGARIVLCLHDELLVHAPADQGPAVADLVAGCLQEAVGRWAPARSSVRFVADIGVVGRWSDAKS